MDKRYKVLWLFFVGCFFRADVNGQPTSFTKGRSNSTSQLPTNQVSSSPQSRQLGGFFPDSNLPGEGFMWNGNGNWHPGNINININNAANGIRFCLRPRGQFPHPLYCDRFYNCWDGAVYVQPCPSGLMFQSDPNRPYCDYPANVQCGSRRPSGSTTNGICPQISGIFPHPQDCRLFVSCVGGKAIVQTCPRTLFFNPELQVCDYSYNVECRTGRPPVTPEVTVPEVWHRPGNDNWWQGQTGSGIFPNQPGFETTWPGQIGSRPFPRLGAGVHTFPVYAGNQKSNTGQNIDERENSLQPLKE